MNINIQFNPNGTAPETVFGVAQEREPRRSVIMFGAVVCGQNSADYRLETKPNA